MSDQAISRDPQFLITKEYRRFAEFCDACCRYRYIGICYGAPGVGKTLSAWHYTYWDLFDPFLATYRLPASLPGGIEALPEEVKRSRTLLYTATVVNGATVVAYDLGGLLEKMNRLIDDVQEVFQGKKIQLPAPNYIELVIVDEADRLKIGGLEQLRDMYDHFHFGVVLIGIPGLEKRLARYPQLYSRVGFVHHFRPLSADEAHFILEHKWKQLGVSLQADDFTDAEAAATVIRITGGNFRLIQRLCTQIERILQINELHTITKEVVEAAREHLVIGS